MTDSRPAMTTPSSPASRYPLRHPLASIAAPTSGAAMAVPAFMQEPCHPIAAPRDLAGTAADRESIEEVRVGAQKMPARHSRPAACQGLAASAASAVVAPRPMSRARVEAPRGSIP